MAVKRWPRVHRPSMGHYLTREQQFRVYRHLMHCGIKAHFLHTFHGNIYHLRNWFVLKSILLACVHVYNHFYVVSSISIKSRFTAQSFAIIANASLDQMSSIWSSLKIEKSVIRYRLPFSSSPSPLSLFCSHFALGYNL